MTISFQIRTISILFSANIVAFVLLLSACKPATEGRTLIQVVGPESGLINPFGVAFDDAGAMWIAEYEGGRLWKHEPGQALQRMGEDIPFNGMHNLARTRDGRIYISDTRANYVRMIDEKTGQNSIVAGTGETGYNGDGIPAKEAIVHDPISISLSPNDKRLYIADIRGFRIRYIDLETQLIHTLAGTGKPGIPTDGALAQNSPLVDPRAVAEDAQGNVYILSRRGHALRVVRPDGKIYTIAGTGEPHTTDGPALQSGFKGPKHICIDTDDTVIIADAENHLIRRYDPQREMVTTVLDRGPDGSPLKRPHGVWVTPDRSLYVCDSYNNRILKLRQ